MNQLRDLAAVAGGVSLIDTNDLAGAVERVPRDASDYFVIGCEPDKEEHRRRPWPSSRWSRASTSNPTPTMAAFTRVRPHARLQASGQAAVDVRRAPDGRSIEPGARVPLFAARTGRPGLFKGHQYSVSRDGLRFLVGTATEESTTPPIGVIVNWRPRPR